MRCYWELRYDLPAQTLLSVPFGCTGRSHFVFNLLNPWQAAMENGQITNTFDGNLGVQITRPFTKHLCGPTWVVVVDFTPNGLYRLYRLPHAELKEQFIDLAAAIPFGTLVEQMRQAPSVGQRVALLNTFLLRQLARRQPAKDPISAATQLLQQTGTLNVRQLAERINLSERTLNRTFTQQVGVSPKYYARIQRFLRTRTWLEQQHVQPDWRYLLATNEYYDQAHFINEFKFFTGKPPLLYKAEAAGAHDFLRQE